MKKIVALVSLSLTLSLSSAFAMIPPCTDSSCPESFYEKFIYFPTIVSLLLSQIILFCICVTFLYRAYVSKIVTISGAKKRLLTLFSSLYTFSFFVFPLGLFWTSALNEKVFELIFVSLGVYLQLSQVIFFLGCLIFLYKVFVPKLEIKKSKEEWFLVLFATVYILSFLAIMPEVFMFNMFFGTYRV